ILNTRGFCSAPTGCAAGALGCGGGEGLAAGGVIVLTVICGAGVTGVATCGAGAIAGAGFGSPTGSCMGGLTGGGAWAAAWSPDGEACFINRATRVGAADSFFFG